MKIIINSAIALALSICSIQAMANGAAAAGSAIIHAEKIRHAEEENLDRASINLANSELIKIKKASFENARFNYKVNVYGSAKEGEKTPILFSKEVTTIGENNGEYTQSHSIPYVSMITQTDGKEPKIEYSLYKELTLLSVSPKFTDNGVIASINLMMPLAETKMNSIGYIDLPQASIFSTELRIFISKEDYQAGISKKTISKMNGVEVEIIATKI